MTKTANEESDESLWDNMFTPSVIEVAWRLGELTHTDTFLDLNSFDGRLLTQAYFKTKCKCIGYAQTEKNFLCASKDYYIAAALDSLCKANIEIIKAEKNYEEVIQGSEPTVVFYCPIEDQYEKVTKIFLQDCYGRGIRIVSTKSLKFLSRDTRSVTCLDKEGKNGMKLYFYKDESDSLSRLRNFLDPMKNPLISTIFNGMLVVFLCFLVYLAAHNIHTNHVVILLGMTVILQIGINWFLTLLRSVHKQLEADLEEATRLTELT